MRSVNIDDNRNKERLIANIEWLKENSADYSAIELAKRFRCKYNQLYGFIRKNGLSVKKEARKSVKKKVIMTDERFVTDRMMWEWFGC
jgi:molybdate-binding protein